MIEIISAAIINKLVNFSFEKVFDKGFDFLGIFEYLIKIII